MKKIFFAFVCGASLFLSACSSNDLYDDVSSEMQSFIVQYFPGQNIESVTTVDGDCHVTIDGGATMVFGSNSAWISIDGRGSALPQVLVYDQLPGKLYEYLQSTDNADNVYTLSRDNTKYVVGLFDYTLNYDIATEKITGEYLGMSR